ncbi:MAG: hypothetical protein JXA13_05950 [Anaerolineales bacterium]|nr:hypothetical protein [Anaerolineales bacterium]
MRKILSLLYMFALILTACTPPNQAPTPSSTPQKVITPTKTLVLYENILVVDSTVDSGAGSFRAALSKAEPDDTITFNPEIFKIDDPATIAILQPLPELNQDYLTIDASNTGVILDGGGGGYGALSVNAQHITIQGLHIVNFDGTAITLWENAHYNTIGGDPQIGAGPLGQGNLITGNRDGIIIQKGGSHHTIAGNQIGIEFNGLVGNTYSGIQINDHSPGNVIGPDNVIAYSGAPSIDITTGDTQGTTITRNLIYGEDTVLRLVPQVESPPAAPVILFYEPSGTVSGVACPGCEVEIFSGEDRWAEFYEGIVTADPDDIFTFSAGTPFSGPNLKATATTPSGATSNFSLPTPGERWTLELQEGNTSPAQVLTSLSSKDIVEDNRISQHGYYPYCWLYCWAGAPFLDNLGGMGIKRIRLSFNEMEVSYDLNQSEYLDENHDSCINAFQSEDMTISYIISFWGKEAQNAGGEIPCERFANAGPGDPETEDYLQYVRDIVEYLSERGVHEYEIWNEPDNFACTQGIRSENYITLVSLAVPEIKAIDPEARIFVGAPSGTDGPDAAAYLRTIADADKIMPIVDGLTWHPFYGPSPAFSNGANYYYNYPTFAKEIKTLASESGFTGEYRVDELTWRGLRNADPGQPWAYEDLIMPKYYARGILMHLGMDIAAGVDVDARYQLVYSTVRNLSTVMAGHTAANLDVTIESDADNILSYSFLLSTGDQLFTLWTNDAAVEYDPGIDATLIFSFEEDMPASVTGIDVLQGYTQPLEFEVNGNKLIIDNLLVKDYPIMIKFSDSQ